MTATSKSAKTSVAKTKEKEHSVKGKGFVVKPELPTWTTSDWFGIVCYFCLSFYNHEVGIANSGKVVWDEAHFGKFASYYINRTFYFDVHPPLGKMIIAFIARMAGYDGSFAFESGAVYPETVDYTFIRFCLAIFGAAMAPMAFATSSAFGWSFYARHLLAIFVLFENSWLAISRFILLDSTLLFFTFASVMGLAKAHEAQLKQRFSKLWVAWLFFTGIMLGCVLSVKWVGLFAVAIVGLYTINDLWTLLGDGNVNGKAYAYHWLIRIAALVVVPICIYTASFLAHFRVLNASGPGDAQMSSLFQAHLKNTTLMSNSTLHLAYGSRVTIKNNGYGGGLLHSHVQPYPEGSKQQQVTTYHHRDRNNEFTVARRWGEQPTHTIKDGEEFVKNGDIVRFVHVSTQRNLHSHKVPAPLSKIHNEVSCYGNATFGDLHDYWTIEKIDSPTSERISTLTDRFHLRHTSTGCYLSSGERSLPEWGFKQREVTCRKRKDKTSIWTIESNLHDKLPSEYLRPPKPSFLQNFIHLNTAMARSNNALIPDPDKEDLLASKPSDWPWLYNGLRMNSWADDNIKFYLIGNPIVWWSSTLSLFLFAATWAWYAVQRQRRALFHLNEEQYSQFLFVGWQVAALGWLLHFLPFFVMARVCYLHHYLPTLYFSVIMLAHMLDHWIFNSHRAHNVWLKNALFVSIAALVYLVFQHFSYNAYGLIGPANDVRFVKWRSSWNIKD